MKAAVATVMVVENTRGTHTAFSFLKSGAFLFGAGSTLLDFQAATRKYSMGAWSMHTLWSLGSWAFLYSRSSAAPH